MTSVPVESDAGTSKTSAAAIVATIAVYLITLASMATIGVVVPQMNQLSQQFDVTMAALGAAIGLYSLPAALFSIPLGAVIDRLGAKFALILAAICALCADVVIYQSNSLLTLQIGLAAAGVGNALIITSAPALLMTTLAGQLQVRAMSLWSTYGPAGYALGLLIGAPFSGGPGLRLAILCLIGLLLVATLVAIMLLPAADRTPRPGPRAKLSDALAMFADGVLLRISLAYGIVAGVSYGSSLAAPGFLARTYGVSMASSATAIAAAKIVAMLLGGVGMGWLLGSQRDRRTMFMAVCLFGLIAQFVLFAPVSGMISATMAMITWLFAYGAISATSFVTLAQFTQDPARAGLASGLIGQLSSLACVLAPTVYFAIDRWFSFVAVSAVGLALIVVLFPYRSTKV